MELKFKLTKFIEDFIKDAILQEIGIGCSDSQIVKIIKKSGTYFLKVSENKNIKTEHMKLQWLQGKLQVPKIISYEEKDFVNYLLTEDVGGEMVCTDFYIKNYRQGLDIIIEAFRVLKNIDVSDCPFNVGLDYKLNLIKNNIDNNLLDVKNINSDILVKYGSIEGIYEHLILNKPEEELIFSHGDTSLPNIFAKDDRLIGFIDVAECGIADFWFDVAITAKSIKRNYGGEAVQSFYKMINREIKYENIEYYMIMMNLYL
jgi:aminoglycoside phosphotransferase